MDALRKELSSYDSVKLANDPFEEHYFNKLLSDSLPLNRNIRDTREQQWVQLNDFVINGRYSCNQLKFHSRCSMKRYRIGEDELQSVSVIINYHNEALSALLRTIISILNRTPPDLLREIILIDDYSEKGG